MRWWGVIEVCMVMEEEGMLFVQGLGGEQMLRLMKADIVVLVANFPASY